MRFAEKAGEKESCFSAGYARIVCGQNIGGFRIRIKDHHRLAGSEQFHDLSHSCFQGNLNLAVIGSVAGDKIFHKILQGFRSQPLIWNNDCAHDVFSFRMSISQIIEWPKHIDKTSKIKVMINYNIPFSI